LNRLLRKVRGALGIGLTWGVLWAAIAIVTGLIIGVVDPDSIDPGEGPLVAGRIIGFVGFVSGVAFSLLLSLAEQRRKSILDLSLIRVALWGAVGAAAPLLVTGMPDGMVVFTSPLGAAFASASVAIARRAERRHALASPSPANARLSSTEDSQ
jgi:hypothetical protein